MYTVWIKTSDTSCIAYLVTLQLIQGVQIIGHALQQQL